MALNLEYIARETGQNLKRNITLTIASVLTVVVSLTLVGVSLLVRQGVTTMSGKFRGDIELIVYLNVDVQPTQRDAVRRALEADPEVKDFTYVNKAQAFEEYKELFKDQPEFIEAANPSILPPSFRVTPVNPGFEAVQAIKANFVSMSGVFKVVSADDTIKVVQQLTDKLNSGILLAATALLGAAWLLIFNTIRTAMFARRREIEVMKLVGATNWFIRIPFMLEGLIQGVVGGALAAGSVALYNRFLTTQLDAQPDAGFLQSFVVAGPDVTNVALVVLVLGALVGALGSGLAVGRFLDV